MEFNSFKSLWIVYMVIGVGYGYSRLRDTIPNGHNVPHPCNKNRVWNAVGHKAPEYTSGKNAFGLRMKAVNLDWQAICREDSDGDGLTNGEELGDRDCQWAPNNGFRLSRPLGHPGYCDRERADRCPEANKHNECRGAGRGGHIRPPQTPAPHFGKHPQAILRERMDQSGFGGQGPIGGGFGQSFLPTVTPPSAFRPQEFPGSFGGPSQSIGGGSFGSLSSPSSGFNGAPSWESAAPSHRGMEPTRDTFSMNLNQRFLQGGGSGGFPSGFSSGFQQQPSSSFESHVQRRIQRARNTAGVRQSPFSSMQWQSSSGGSQMRPQFMPQFYPDPRSFGGRRTAGF